MSDSMPIERGKIREFARATGSKNPDYDREGAPVPPTFLTTMNFWATDFPTAGLGFELARILHGEEEFEFFGPPPAAGQTLTFTSRVGDQWEKEGKRGGTMRFAKMITEFRDDAGVLVAEKRTTIIETGEGALMTLSVGDTIEPRAFGPITRTDIVRYAGASGDFNPIHHDEHFAKSAGFPTVFSIGMYQAALLATFATDWLGAENVRRFTVRFKEQVWPDDVLTCGGTVTEVAETADGQQVTVELTCTRQTGGVAIGGEAVFVVG